MKTNDTSSQLSPAETGNPAAAASSASLSLRYPTPTSGRQERHYRMYLECKILAMAALIDCEQLQLKTLSDRDQLKNEPAQVLLAEKQDASTQSVPEKEDEKKVGEERKWLLLMGSSHIG